jgi:hypothetical protein
MRSKWINEGSAISVRLVKFTSITMLVALLPCVVLFGQSASPTTQLQTFHIRGTIRAFNDSAVPGAEVTFESQKISTTVSSDKSGYYEANLPVGLYSMTAKPVDRYLQRYRRPLFRVASPTSLTFNITLDTAGPFCDIKKPVLDQPLPADDGVRICGGADSFPVPSQDGVPFDLFIQYDTLTTRARIYPVPRARFSWPTTSSQCKRTTFSTMSRVGRLRRRAMSSPQTLMEPQSAPTRWPLRSKTAKLLRWTEHPSFDIVVADQNHRARSRLVAQPDTDPQPAAERRCCKKIIAIESV